MPKKFSERGLEAVFAKTIFASPDAKTRSGRT